MSKFLIDSDVIIWHLRGQAKTKELLANLQRAGVPACSSFSILEVQIGVKEGEEEKTTLFLNSLKIYEVDRDIANEAARYVREYKKKGITLSLPDAVIAATCVIYELILVTYNPKHYFIPDLRLYPL